jgi:hypothetical protein
VTDGWQRFEALGRSLTEELRSHGQTGATAHPATLHIEPKELYGRVSGLARAANEAGALVQMDATRSGNRPPSKTSAPDCVPEVVLFGGPEMVFEYGPRHFRQRRLGTVQGGTAVSLWATCSACAVAAQRVSIAK